MDISKENAPTAKDGEVHYYGFKSGSRGLVLLPLSHLVQTNQPQGSSELDTLYYLCYAIPDVFPTI